MDGLCAGWCVDYVLGRVVFSGFFFVKVWCGCWCGCAHCLVVCCYILYVHCVLALLSISLCRDVFVYGSVILSVVLGAPNLCGRCGKSAEVSR